MPAASSFASRSTLSAAASRASFNDPRGPAAASPITFTALRLAASRPGGGMSRSSSALSAKVRKAFAAARWLAMTRGASSGSTRYPPPLISMPAGPFTIGGCGCCEPVIKPS